jgi:predicted Rossmann fold nucleotide-binding protein DprA/Smf involved in DNA uptake
LLDNFTAKRNIRELREIIQSKEAVNKIIEFLKEEYSDFGPDVVEGALNGIQIELSYDLESTDNHVPKNDHDSPNGLLATVLDTIHRHKDGIGKKDLISITGFTDKQITNAIYKLKVRNVITSERRGFYKANSGWGDDNISNKFLSKKTKMSNNEEELTGLQEGTMIYTIYNLISKRKKSGYTVEELKIETGFESRQIANLLYKLSKKGYVNAVERGRYVAN